MNATRLPVASSAQVRSRAVALLLAHRGAVAAVAAVQVLAALAAVAIPRLLGSMVDVVHDGGPQAASSLYRLIAAVVVVAVVGAVLTGLGEYLSRLLGERVFAALRERLVDAVMHLPLSVVEEAGTGDLLGRTSHDVDAIRFVVQRGVGRLLVIALTIVTVVVAGVLASPLLGAAMVAGMVMVYPVTRWYLRRAVPGYKAMRALWAEVNGTVAETADQATTVEAQGLGKRRNCVTERALREVWATETYTLWLRYVMGTALSAATMGALIAVAVLGAWLVGRGTVTVGEATAVLLYALQLRSPLHELIFWLDSVQSASASLARIVGVELVEADRRATSRAVVGAPPRARGVTYAYRQGHDVLHGIDLEIVPGERLVIVGPSGSGKSTLGRLLAGIHPPSTGRVTIGGDEGVDLTALSEDALHREVVLVTQEHHVFACTLADNLRIVRTDATDEEILRALDVVGAGQWARALSQGLETDMGADAYRLDPGQAQQVALARILLMDPHTLILDEATSLLDPGVARSAESSLDAVLQGRTVVAIAHRLDTAAAADRVAVLIDGRIVELGGHEELLAAGGEYTRLWHAWTSR